MTVAIAGRLTPVMRPMRSSADAIVAPVFPADTIALRTTVAYRFGGPHQRGVLLATNRLGGIVVHVDDLARLDQREIGDVDAVAEIGRADQHDGSTGPRRREGGCDDDLGGVVATHCIDGNGHHRRGGARARQRR